jgi:hypothetical protein
VKLSDLAIIGGALLFFILFYLLFAGKIHLREVIQHTIIESAVHFMGWEIAGIASGLGAYKTYCYFKCLPRNNHGEADE